MAAVVLVLAGCQAAAAPTATEPLATATVTTEPAPTPPSATSPAAGASATPGCDPADQLFAGMLTGLTKAALVNAGIEPEQFLAALSGDRALLKTYLEALGLPVDDAWIDALISADPGQQLLRQCLGTGAAAPTASP